MTGSGGNRLATRIGCKSPIFSSRCIVTVGIAPTPKPSIKRLMIAKSELELVSFEASTRSSWK